MESLFYCYPLALVLMQCCFIIVTSTAMIRTDVATDRSALLALKAHITSDPHQFLSKNWSSNAAAASSVCDWIGVECGSRHLRVTALNISSMGLAGTVPPEVGNLSFLVSLDMGSNYFHGNLPQELSRLRRLKFISLSSNNFTGAIPMWVGHFPELQVLALYNNDFTGLIPSSISNLSKLEHLDFRGNSLRGQIPEQIGNLQSLKFLNLESNQLTGSIPLSIFNISTMEKVGFTFNNLSGTLPVYLCRHLPNLSRIALSFNQIHGQIPSSLSQCSQLEMLSLSDNNFSGSIPKEIGNLEMLEGLYLGTNNLQGLIPREIGNLRNLKEFGIERNQITGSIPREIGNLTELTLIVFAHNFLTGTRLHLISDISKIMFHNILNLLFPGSLRIYTCHFHLHYLIGVIPEEMSNLHKLEALYLIFNELNGSIPVGIFNLSTLSVVSLGFNHLTGNLPSNIGYQWPNLEKFHLDGNNIGGIMPASIVNCSKLTILSLPGNRFTGSIPNSIGNLELLESLFLSDNNLTSDPTSLELEFLTSLTNCKHLKTLELAENPLNGVLPASIGNLSTSLQYFNARASNIKGPIPREIGNLSSLLLISLEDNQLTGDIPRTVQDLQNLQVLSLMRNKLGGSLDSFCKMHSLSELYLSQNQIPGIIPDCFGNMTSLRDIYLRSNLLTSTIPRSLWKLRDLLVLVLASNSLIGSLPLEVGNLKAAINIDMSMNQISGEIPLTMGDLQNLQNLSLADNQLLGSIPESFGNLFSLTSLDLSNNSLSGLIPKSLDKLQSLKVLNLSSNHLRGEIPSAGPFRSFTSESFISNDALCGDPKFDVPPCQTNPQHGSKLKRVLLITLCLLGIAIVVVLALAVVFIRFQRKKKVPSATDFFPGVTRKERVSYYELLQATNGYGESNLIGSGSFGSVYKATLGDGRSVAVKVFNLQLEGAEKSFDVECDALCNLRHRNLVKVISSCSKHDFKALVLEYMCNGNLEKWLHSPNYFLNVFQRLDIMIDVASALQYLHHEYSTPVIHCDLKPSNVLIDEDMVAHVSDFGIAKFLGKEESTALTKTLATIGYMAPEYGLEGLVSTACDVYSYGILLMEVFTGRRPSDEMFDGNINLKSWVKDSMPNATVQVIDAKLLKPNEERYAEKLECLSLIMRLALNCVPESPKERLSMKAVVDTLHKIKLRYLECHVTDVNK
ncbi:uncharacterized protein [Coffea arabica]|uniref:Uncharacterized protein isoform X1 n=1 Tax=Coffea arabica TaxID=13443 RepID=A0ABM4VFI8_COFAR